MKFRQMLRGIKRYRRGSHSDFRTRATGIGLTFSPKDQAAKFPQFEALSNIVIAVCFGECVSSQARLGDRLSGRRFRSGLPS